MMMFRFFFFLTRNILFVKIGIKFSSQLFNLIVAIFVLVHQLKFLKMLQLCRGFCLKAVVNRATLVDDDDDDADDDDKLFLWND